MLFSKTILLDMNHSWYSVQYCTFLTECTCFCLQQNNHGRPEHLPPAHWEHLIEPTIYRLQPRRWISWTWKTLPSSTETCFPWGFLRPRCMPLLISCCLRTAAQSAVALRMSSHGLTSVWMTPTRTTRWNPPWRLPTCPPAQALLHLVKCSTLGHTLLL